MKPTKKELALEEKRADAYDTCCWLLKYQSLYKHESMSVGTASCLHQLVSAMGQMRLDALLRFMDTLP